MADGILCLNCGWSESAHLLKDTVDNWDKPRDGGWKVSLMDCPGYFPEDPELAQKFEVEHRVKFKIWKESC